jgi:hypothetical protein
MKKRELEKILRRRLLSEEGRGVPCFVDKPQDRGCGSCTTAYGNQRAVGQEDIEKPRYLAIKMIFFFSSADTLSAAREKP